MLHTGTAVATGWPLRHQDPWEGHRTMALNRSLRARLRQRRRWECTCTNPPTLLAIYEPGGLIEIKMRDRVYVTSGCVHATCPRCGVQHVLDLRPDNTTDNTLPGLDASSGPGPNPKASGGWG